ncbi:hypothetical protein A9Q84_10415 [Halobacteriovorax marinus]|uniref:Uncharacterized protein n=1 Tax=Halobacteriovorax marinus TaxID=97084 RepID=A0A1Y5F7N3_9BACT|nr:hypothetical protein A9Q84_10415 [Halobacteriovorax marinus]
MKKTSLKILVSSLIVLLAIWSIFLKDKEPKNSVMLPEDIETLRVVKNKQQVKPLGEEVLQANLITLAKNLEITISKDQAFRKLNDYRIDVKDLKFILSKELLKTYSLKLSNKLSMCIIDNFCGTKPDSAGYFDENGTPAHSLLARTLALLDLNLEYKDLQLDDIPFQDLLKLENTKILESTASLLLKANPTESELENYLDIAQDLEGANKQIFFSTLIRSSNSYQRSHVIEALATQFKDSDPYSIVAFFQKLSSLTLSSEELAKLASSGCHLKLENQISWNSFRFHLKKYIEKNKMDIDLNQLCP